MSTRTVYLKHESGAMHALTGRPLAKLLADMKADRGQPGLVRLIESGYRETMGDQSIDALTYESLLAEAEGRFEKEG
jgi:hypothetical protein